MSTTTSSQSKALTKKELKKFQELLEEKRKVVLERARQMLSEGMVLDANDLPDEMDLAASEYIQSFEFRLRGREKSLLSKLDLALKKIEEGTFGICEICEEPIGNERHGSVAATLQDADRAEIPGDRRRASGVFHE